MSRTSASLVIMAISVPLFQRSPQSQPLPPTSPPPPIFNLFSLLCFSVAGLLLQAAPKMGLLWRAGSQPDQSTVLNNRNPRADDRLRQSLGWESGSFSLASQPLLPDDSRGGTRSWERTGRRRGNLRCRLVNGWMDAWLACWLPGSMDGWMDGWKANTFCLFHGLPPSHIPPSLQPLIPLSFQSPPILQFSSAPSTLSQPPLHSDNPPHHPSVI